MRRPNRPFGDKLFGKPWTSGSIVPRPAGTSPHREWRRLESVVLIFPEPLEIKDLKSKRLDSDRLQPPAAIWRTVQQGASCSGHCNIRVPTSSEIPHKLRRNDYVCCDNAFLRNGPWHLCAAIVNTWQESRCVGQTPVLFSFRHIPDELWFLWREKLLTMPANHAGMTESDYNTR